MPVNVSRLRVWFATAAIVLAVVVAGFYFYGRLRLRRAIKEVPKQLGERLSASWSGPSAASAAPPSWSESP